MTTPLLASIANQAAISLFNSWTSGGSSNTGAASPSSNTAQTSNTKNSKQPTIPNRFPARQPGPFDSGTAATRGSGREMVVNGKSTKSGRQDVVTRVHKNKRKRGVEREVVVKYRGGVSKSDEARGQNRAKSVLPANSIWSSMSYPLPRGRCLQKTSIMTSCPCLRFMVHPLKAQTSFECDGCGHHASFHAMKSHEDEVEEAATGGSDQEKMYIQELYSDDEDDNDDDDSETGQDDGNHEDVQSDLLEKADAIIEQRMAAQRGRKKRVVASRTPDDDGDHNTDDEDKPDNTQTPPEGRTPRKAAMKATERLHKQYDLTRVLEIDDDDEATVTSEGTDGGEQQQRQQQGQGSNKGRPLRTKRVI